MANRVKKVNSYLETAQEEGMEFFAGYNHTKFMPKIKVPEVAVCGRSNVGKSSALNCLSCRRKKVAVTSKTPGRTRMINLFKLGKACTITDLPGYGYASVDGNMKQMWKQMVSNYLSVRQGLKLVIVLVDARQPPQKLDAAFLDFAETQNRTTLVVATKADKLKKAELEANLLKLRAGLDLPPGQPVPFSSVTGHGMEDVWQQITALCTNTALNNVRRNPRPRSKESSRELIVYDEDTRIRSKAR